MANLKKKELQAYAYRLFLALSNNGSLNDLLEEAHILTKNSFHVFDVEGRIIGANEKALENDPFSRQTKAQGYLKPEDMEAIDFQKFYKDVMQSDRPLISTNPKLKGNHLSIRIIIDRTLIGILTMTETGAAITDDDFESITLIRDFVIQILQKDIQNKEKHGNRYEFFFSDLLDGKIDNKIQMEERYANIEFSLGDLNYISVVTLKQQDEVFATSFVRNELGNAMSDTYTFFYRDRIAMLTIKPAANPLSDAMVEKVSKICEKYSIVGAVSNPFHRIEQAPDYYQQALATIDLARSQFPVTGFFRWSQYAVQSFFNNMDESSIIAFTHPAILKLANYDKTHGTELMKSLKYYLLHDHNLTTASKKLFIHRNSLLNRINKIRNLVLIDINDSKEQLYLIMSCIAVEILWKKLY